MTRPRRRPRLGPVAASVGATVLGVLPVYLVGGLSAFIRNELTFTATALGAAVGAFFAMSAILSAPCGRYAERYDAWTVLRVSLLLSMAALLGIAGLVHAWAHLVGFLLLAGVANALAQPTANRAIAGFVVASRHGLMLGAKQAAVPAASLAAGLGVPLLAQPLGWRWAFALAAGFGVLLFLGMPRITAGGPARVPAVGQSARPRLSGITWLTTGAAFGASAANSVPVFVTGSLIAAGFDAGVSGWLLALGSATSIAGRLALGHLADRRQVNRFALLALVMVSGAAGLVLLAVAPALDVVGVAATVSLLLGVGLAFGAGWGWQGLFQLAIVTRFASAPSAATGTAVSGVYIGGIAGPVALGAIVDHVGYPAAWSVGAACLVIGGAVMWNARP